MVPRRIREQRRVGAMLQQVLEDAHVRAAGVVREACGAVQRGGAAGSVVLVHLRAPLLDQVLHTVQLPVRSPSPALLSRSLKNTKE